jgi:hypothetical protein
LIDSGSAGHFANPPAFETPARRCVIISRWRQWYITSSQRARLLLAQLAFGAQRLSVGSQRLTELVSPHSGGGGGALVGTLGLAKCGGPVTGGERLALARGFGFLPDSSADPPQGEHGGGYDRYDE